MGQEGHEGEALHRLLVRAQKTSAELARQAYVSPAAVSKWLRRVKFGKQQWLKVSVALRALGLDPREIRPHGARNGDADAPPFPDMLPTVHDILSPTKLDRAEKIKALIKLLESPPNSRLAAIAHLKLKRDRPNE